MSLASDAVDLALKWSVVIRDCRDQDIELTDAKCKISFGNSLEVDKFGETSRGTLAPNTDLAGRGSLIAFAVPGIIIAVYAIVLALVRLGFIMKEWRKLGSTVPGTKWSDRLHESFDDLISSAGDAQLLLILAYEFAFRNKLRCDVSAYHMVLGLHTIFAGLSTSLLSLIVARPIRKNYISSWARLALFITCLVGLVEVLFKQRARLVFFKARVPGKEQRDSPLILPAYCFYGLFQPFKGIDEAQTAYLAPAGPANNSVVQFGFVVGALVICVLFCYLGGWCFINSEKECMKRYTILFIPKFLAGLALLGLAVSNWITIISLRDWVADSGWLKFDNGRNEEQDIQTLGQIAPLIALGAMVFTFTGLLTNYSTSLIQKYVYAGFLEDPKQKSPDSGLESGGESIQLSVRDKNHSRRRSPAAGTYSPLG